MSSASDAIFAPAASDWMVHATAMIDIAEHEGIEVLLAYVRENFVTVGEYEAQLTRLGHLQFDPEGANDR